MARDGLVNTVEAVTDNSYQQIKLNQISSVIGRVYATFFETSTQLST